MARPRAGRRRPASFFPRLLDPDGAEAIRVGETALSYRELAGASAAVAAAIQTLPRVAIWAAPTLETAVAVVAALRAGVAIVPLNPRMGDAEIDHVLADAEPAAVLHPPGAELSPALLRCRRIAVDIEAGGELAGEEFDGERAALIVYTSGTTGPPKGAVLPRRAVASNLDALAEAWAWTAADTVVHALPLFHVHGLIVGTLGPIRLGGHVRHLGGWSSPALVEALRSGGTMLFAVPTMYHRLAAEVAANVALAGALSETRLLVSGSAPLSLSDHNAIAQATGQGIVERYGLTETLMNCAVRADGERRPGSVGPALAGIDLRLLDDGLGVVADRGPDATGEIAVRGPNLFSGYLNRPDATAQVLRDGWFRTGDQGWLDADGYVRIIGRKSTDIIKTGGYKVGAGEVEAALLEHPQVAQAAVAAELDDDLGERITAWVVAEPGPETSAEELIEYVAERLAPHKRPRRILFIDDLPRNDMGKVVKSRLSQAGGGAPGGGGRGEAQWP